MALKKCEATNTKEQKVIEEAALHLPSKLSRGTTVTVHHPWAAGCLK